MVKAFTFLTISGIAVCTLSALVDTHEQLQPQAVSTESSKSFAKNTQAALLKCSKTESTRTLQERTVTRRTEAVEKLRQDHRERIVDITANAKTSHKSSLTGITASTSASILFSTSTTCIAQPEVTEGPYFVNGEFIRTDMREEQAGVLMYMDVQVIDINTCEPVKGMYIDFWHANATGAYSGVVASDDETNADRVNLQSTFLRGVTPTDKDGVAQMISIFPGHYAGRTTHVHFIGNYDGTVLSNNTYSGGHVAHVGQFFFDQDLITSVEALTPYSTNKQSTTSNSKDQVFKTASEGGYDPIFQYALVGDTLEDGIFVWISVGVDMTAERDVKAVSTFSASTRSNGNAALSTTISGGLTGSLVLLAFTIYLL